MLTLAGSRRLSAFGCQNGFVGLALVNQTGPGEKNKLRIMVLRDLEMVHSGDGPYYVPLTRLLCTHTVFLLCLKSGMGIRPHLPKQVTLF